jgi:Flp pilus assembly protein TadG
MKRITDNQRGAFVVIFAVALLVILGFVALGIEGGRWYLVRAELAKGVDAAALAGARNISNPFVTATTLAEEFGRENFEAGYVGTPQTGAGAVRFTATMVESDKISVTGNVNATATLARLFGIDTIPVAAASVAQKKEVEIMMILDRSGSMAGTKMTALKNAAKSFLAHFQGTQDKDKVGLISFASTVKYEWDLGLNYYTGANLAKIDNMIASGGTNMGSAFDAADGWTDSTTTVSAGNVISSAAGTTPHTGFTDQTGVPGSSRVQQFAVFFSDGQPTCFSGNFRYRGSNFTATACSTDNCRTWETSALWQDLNKPNPGCETATSGSAACGGSSAYLASSPTRVLPLPTGTGQTTQCCTGGSCYSNTIRWYLFDTRPVPGYAAQYCGIPSNRFNGYSGYMCSTARDLATFYAQDLKSKGVKIYVIGLGSSNQIDATYLQSLSSGSGFTYIAPTAADLEGIFNKVAKDIKLRLIY